MTSQLTDKELWDAIVSDHSRAFIVLYNRYWRKVYKTALYYTKDDSAAEEITHDVFVILWTRRSFLKIENFAGYLHMTTRYHVFKHLKAVKGSCIDYVEDYSESNEPVVYNLAEHALSYESLETELAGVLNGLPKRCREIFWLSRVKELSNDEIALQLNISKRTVENQITQALKYLRVSYSKPAALLLFTLLFSR